MSEFPKEKGGLPPPKGGEGTAKTFFSEGINYGEAKILFENKKLMHKYPEYGKSGDLITLVYNVDDYGKGKVYVAGPRGGSYPLYMADGETLNPGLPKTVLLGQKELKLSSKRMKKSKSLTKPSKRTRGLQMMKMNNLLYVNELVKEL